MLTRIFPISLCSLLLLLAVFSCEKDPLLPAGTDLEPLDMTLYDQLGPKIETAVSLALADEVFMHRLIDLTQEQQTGDFEALWSTFLDSPLKGGGTIQDIFLDFAGGQITAAELSAFTEAYPSLIVATRGSIKTWLEGTHEPPVVFVPSNFDEASLSIAGHRNGQAVSVSLERTFEDAVIALHISERHDRYGNLLGRSNDYLADDKPTNKGPNPSVDMSAKNFTPCPPNSLPEPTACPSPINMPQLINFTATAQNGGIFITYNIENFPEELCSWGRVRITRYGPQGATEYIRYAHDEPAFNDSNIDPNTTYNYVIDAYIAYQSDEAPGDHWVTCSAINNELTAEVTAPGLGDKITSFIGEPINNTTIKYSWYPTTGVAASQFRLRVMTDNGYEEIATIQANSGNNFYFYDPPIDARGQMTEVQIQGLSAGNWGGDFFDRSYLPHREAGLPLNFYGIRVNDLSTMEVGESPIYGAPEIRLVAIQGNSSDPNDNNSGAEYIIASLDVATTNCRSEIQVGGQIYQTPVGNLYFPVDGARPIKHSWDPNLTGSSITIKSTETDRNEVVVTTQEIEESNERSISTNIGEKWGVTLSGALAGITAEASAESEFRAGWESKWRKSVTTKLRYPVEDQDIQIDEIRYHYPVLDVYGQILYGYISGAETDDLCTALQLYIGN